MSHKDGSKSGGRVAGSRNKVSVAKMSEAIIASGVNIPAEMIHSALQIENPFDRVKALALIQRYVECPVLVPIAEPFDVQEVSAPQDILQIIGADEKK